MKNTLTANDLENLLATLLKEDIEKKEVEQTVNEIHQLFQKISQITGYSQEVNHLAAVPTAGGMALGLNHAALCLLDYRRTQLFFKGMVAAIQAKQKEKPNEVIRVFYAGCGPYAPFITLIAPLFQPTEIQFSILEINRNSLQSAKKLIAGLNLENYVEAYHLSDAVTFTVPNADRFDILFSETLDALLYRESYVPILNNLLPQFSSDTILIPENVYLGLSVIQNEKETYLGKIFDTRQSLLPYASETQLPTHFPAKKIHVENLKQHQSIVIDTVVEVYQDLKLIRGESSLTLPCQMNLADNLIGNTLEFTYYLKPQIELKCAIV